MRLWHQQLELPSFAINNFGYSDTKVKNKR